jgi:hypothetical protein
MFAAISVLLATIAYSPTQATVARAARTGGDVEVSQQRRATPQPASRTVAAKPAANRAAARQTSARSAISASPGRVLSNRVAAESSAPAARSAVAPSARARSGTTIGHSWLPAYPGANVSRAAHAARATAVFSDMSKMGGTYANCRETYNTCMDQFCAGKSDEYRRCICSERFREFADLSEGIDIAKNMLDSFSNNNLEAVSLSGAEVNAMYSATAGEAAMKKDVSASAKLLEEAMAALSGQRKKDSGGTAKLNFSDIMSSFSTDIGDIWGGGGDQWGQNSGPNLAEMEGKALFDNTDKQCRTVAQEACGQESTYNMVRSAYGILISQDCNLYQKTIDKKKEAVMVTVREAEKALRSARLEEYRTHNSASVNECIGKVTADVKDQYACGPNWEKCLDFSGLYINSSTGEPIFSPRLFQLSSLINLENQKSKETKVYLDGIDKFRNRAQKSLDSCRDDANMVWEAFRMQALIQIAQAQDEKLQEIRDDCIQIVKECYDKQSGALADLDTTDSQMTGALQARAAKSMCADKVSGCASLYVPPTVTNPEPCKWDGQGKIVNADKCGATALINLVNVVDEVKVLEGCEAALTARAAELCKPENASDVEKFGEYGKCRLRSPAEIRSSLAGDARRFCMGEGGLYGDEGSGQVKLDSAALEILDKIMDKIYEGIDYALSQICDQYGGLWDSDSSLVIAGQADVDPEFVNTVYGGLPGAQKSLGNSEVKLVLGKKGTVATGAAAAAAAQTAATSPEPPATSAAAARINTVVRSAVVSRGSPGIAPPAVHYFTRSRAAAVPEAAPKQTVGTGGKSNVSDLEFENAADSLGWGICSNNRELIACKMQNELSGNKNYAVYVPSSRECVLDAKWYETMCPKVAGCYWKENTCYCKKDQPSANQ